MIFSELFHIRAVYDTPISFDNYSIFYKLIKKSEHYYERLACLRSRTEIILGSGLAGLPQNLLKGTEFKLGSTPAKVLAHFFKT